MSKQLNYTGEIVQLNNSPIFNKLSEKYDLFYDEDYRQLATQLSAYSKMLGRMLGLDLNKVNLLSMLYHLGKVDGGQLTLDRVNEYLPDGKKVSEAALAMYNLRNVYKNPEEIFSPEDLEEIIQMFGGIYKTNEAKVVNYSADLDLIASYMKRYNNWSIDKAANYVKQEGISLQRRFDLAKTITRDEKVDEILTKIKSIPFEYDEETLEKYITDKNLAELSEEEIYEALNDYNPTLEKKTTRGRF